MISFRKLSSLFRYSSVAILVFSGLRLSSATQSAPAPVVDTGSQAPPTLPLLIRGDKLSSFTNRLAAPQPVTAPVVDAGPQAPLLLMPLTAGDNIPASATRLAAPLAAPKPDTASTNEDTPLDINVLQNDTGGTYTITKVITSTTLGLVSINNSVPQTIHYDPTVGLNYLAAGQIYTDTFQYIARNVISTVTSTVPVTVTVTGVDDPPIAVSDLGITTTTEDSAVTLDVLKNDSDPENDPLSITGLITGTAKGAVSIDQTNNILDYDPTLGLNYLAQGQVYTDTFSYIVSDGVLTSTAPVSVRVIGVDDPPIAVSDLGITTTTEDSAVTLDVLKNDSDPENDPLSITGLITGTAKGAVSIDQTNNILDYDPTLGLNYLAQGQVYTDTFSYIVSDGVLTSTAPVSVRVTGVDDPPIAVSDLGITTTTEDSAVTLDVLKNDSDPENDPLSITGLITGTAKGAVSIDQTNNILDYDPTVGLNYLAQGQVYTDTFSYIVSDGVLTSTAPVSVRVTGVNDPPIAVSDLGITTTTEDSAVTLDVLKNDSDPENDPLSITGLITGTAKGAVSIDQTNNILDYDPTLGLNYLAQGQVYTDTFSYIVSDGVLTSTAPVSVRVTGVDDPPIAVSDLVITTTTEDSAVNLDVLKNDSDPENDPLSISGLITGAAKGAVSINQNNTLDYDPTVGLNYLAQGQVYTDTFSYIVSDGILTSTAPVSVRVTGVNDPPIAVSDLGITTTEGLAININVLANDSDPEGDVLTINGLNTTGTLGSVTTNTGNTSVNYDPGMAFNYLGQGQTATDSFGYVVSDGHGGTASAKVTVTIYGINEAPIAVKDTYTTPANKTLSVPAPGVLVNDSDLDISDTLSAVLVSGPTVAGSSLNLNSDGSFTYVPALNYHGLDHFVYHAFDGIAASNNVTVTLGVDVTNQPPVVVADTATTPEDTAVAIHVTANDYDPDGSLNLSTLQVTTSPKHGIAQVNTTTGVITYKPALNYNGIDTFQYEIYDKDAVLPLSGSAPVTVTVTPVNDPPQAASFSQTTKEDTPLVIDLSGRVSDVENDLNQNSLQVITPAGHGTAAVTGNLLITYSPALNYNGSDLIGYQICDKGALCAQANITIDVKPVNDPPVAVNDHYYTKPISLTVNAPGVLANDYDVDVGDHLKASLILKPANGQVNFNNDGSFTYTPNSKFTYGNDRFSYRAYDSNNAPSNTAWVTITVDASPPVVNWQSPKGNGGIYDALPGQQIALLVSATDNIPIARVEFYWWDTKKGTDGAYVDIASLTHAPFRALIDANNLNIGWNQVFARAYDAAGNVNNVGDTNHPGFIWIIRKENIYLPLLSVGR